jgi:hypothetical protein
MNFRKAVYAALIAATCAGVWLSSGANAAASAEIRVDARGSPYTLKKIDCAGSGVHTLHVSGSVQLAYPGEQTPGNLPTIEINCENVIFDPGAKLTSLSSIVLNASSVRGSIVVQTLSRSDGRSGNVTTRIQSGSNSAGERGAAGQGPSIEVESITRGANGANGQSAGSAVQGSNGTAGGSSSTYIDIPGLSGSDTPASGH